MNLLKRSNTDVAISYVVWVEHKTRDKERSSKTEQGHGHDGLGTCIESRHEILYASTYFSIGQTHVITVP